MNNNEILVPELNNETIESMIYEIRGVKVMLVFDLARIYGYETKRFNEQVKNNIEKFPERYRFQISKNELDNLVRSKKTTSRKSNIFEGNLGGTRYLPYAFTEQGIYMLMTVLKGELAKNKVSHDRFIAIDLNYNSHFYLCGSSSKDGGNRLSVIEELENKDICKDIYIMLSKSKIIEF